MKIYRIMRNKNNKWYKIYKKKSFLFFKYWKPMNSQHKTLANASDYITYITKYPKDNKITNKWRKK